MHWCSDGCPDCQFTADHPMAKTILIWSICLWIWQSWMLLHRCHRSNRWITSRNGIHWRAYIWALFHQLQEVSFMTSASKFSTLPKNSIFSIGQFSQHIHNGLIGPSTYTISHLQGVKLLRKNYPYKSVLFSGFFNIEINSFYLFIVPGCYVIANTWPDIKRHFHRLAWPIYRWFCL